MSIKAWLNEPYPPPVRKRWKVLLGLFLKGLAEGIERSTHNQRIAKLEERIERLEKNKRDVEVHITQLDNGKRLDDPEAWKVEVH